MHGWQPQITNAEHHSGKFITSSTLKAALRTPAYYKAYINGDFKSDTDALRLGTLIHTAVLQPSEWDNQVVLCPVDEDGNRLDRRSKANKAIWAELEATAGDKVICTPSEREDALRIAEAVMRNPQAAEWLSVGVAEVTGVVDGDKAIRPDWRNTLGAYLVDLKSCTDASPDAVQRAVVNFDYDLSAAYYCDIAGSIDIQTYRDFVWIFVEKQFPYNVQCYVASIELLDRGRSRYEQALRNIDELEEVNSYPAYYSPLTLPLELPKWVRP